MYICWKQLALKTNSRIWSFLFYYSSCLGVEWGGVCVLLLPADVPSGYWHNIPPILWYQCRASGGPHDRREAGTVLHTGTGSNPPSARKIKLYRYALVPYLGFDWTEPLINNCKLFFIRSVLQIWNNLFRKWIRKKTHFKNTNTDPTWN